MIKRNNIPQIRFSVFSGEWEENQLIDLTNINQGLQIAISNRFTEKIDGSYFYITNEFLKESSNIKYFILNPPESVLCTKDDVLMTRTGNTGEVVTNIDGAFHNNFFKIKFDSKKLTKDYFVYFLKLPTTQALILRLAGVSTIPDLNHKDFYSIIISYPNLTEQTKIGDYFQKLDKLIEQKEKKYQKLGQFKKAMLSKMFPKNGADTPEIRFCGFSGKWEEKELGDIGKTFTGLSGKTKEDFGHGEGKFVTYMNVFSNPISKKNLTEPVEIDDKQNEVQLGDVFFTTSSETPEEVGMASIWIDEGNNIYLNSFCFGYRPEKVFDLYYLAYMLRSSYVRKKIIFLAQGISRYNISKNKVMEIYVPIPDIKEQTKIGNYFQKLDQLIDLQQHELAKLKNLKKAFLSKMFV